MRKHVPYTKQSKKKRRERDQETRRGWEMVVPVTRRFKDSREDKLEKARRRDEPGDGPFHMPTQCHSAPQSLGTGVLIANR